MTAFPALDHIALAVPNLDDHVERLTIAFGMVAQFQFHVLEARSSKLEPRQHSTSPYAAAPRVATPLEHDQDEVSPQEIAALQWINRQLRWERQLAKLHARAGMRTYRSTSARG
jgi:hypothetical protein